MTVYDGSANNNDGTLKGGVTWVDHTGYGMALSFDGTSGYVEVPDSDSLDVTGKLCLEAWIYPKSFKASQLIVCKYNHTSLSSSFYLGLAQLAIGQPFDNIFFSLTYNGNNYYSLYSAADLTANTWTHVAAVANITHMSIYINGARNNVGALPSRYIFAGTSKLRIGAYLPEFGFARYFNGTIDEVRVSVSNIARRLGAVVSVSPDMVSKTYGDYGQYFSVGVQVENVTGLYGFDFNVTWDNSLITYSDYDNSSLDSVWSGGWLTAKIAHGAGWFKFAAASTSAPFTGGNVLFTIEFRVEEPFCNSVKDTLLGFKVHILSDITPLPINHYVEAGLYRIKGKDPTLNLSPGSVQCRKVNEQISISAVILDAQSVGGSVALPDVFRMRFNTTYLDYVSATLDPVWTAVSINVNEAKGWVNCSLYPTSLGNGTVPVITIDFVSSCPHIWKDSSIQPWTNNLTGTIYIYSATLRYPIAVAPYATLNYVRGGWGNGINVPVEVAYTFSPIRGDLDNDGSVGIADLTTLTGRYDITDSDPEWATAQAYDLVIIDNDKAIDIFDIVVVASRYGTTYP